MTERTKRVFEWDDEPKRPRPQPEEEKPHDPFAECIGQPCIWCNRTYTKEEHERIPARAWTRISTAALGCPECMDKAKMRQQQAPTNGAATRVKVKPICPRCGGTGIAAIDVNGKAVRQTRCTLCNPGGNARQMQNINDFERWAMSGTPGYDSPVYNPPIIIENVQGVPLQDIYNDAQSVIAQAEQAIDFAAEAQKIKWASYVPMQARFVALVCLRYLPKECHGLIMGSVTSKTPGESRDALDAFHMWCSDNGYRVEKSTQFEEETIIIRKRLSTNTWIDIGRMKVPQRMRLGNNW